jgi:hypothetical protein
MDGVPRLVMYTQQIFEGAQYYSQRTGQYLFNKLPLLVAAEVAGTSFDPFHKDLSKFEIYEWLDNHLIFQDQRIVGLFHNDVLLWEENS